MCRNQKEISVPWLPVLGFTALTLVGCFRDSRIRGASDIDMNLELARSLTQECLQKIGVDSVTDECLVRVDHDWILVLGGNFPVQEVKFVLDRQGRLEGYYFECSGVFLTMNSLGPSSCEENFNIIEYCASLDANPPSADDMVTENRCGIVNRINKNTQERSEEKE
jgi:hypothetical protein